MSPEPALLTCCPSSRAAFPVLSLSVLKGTHPGLVGSILHPFCPHPVGIFEDSLSLGEARNWRWPGGMLRREPDPPLTLALRLLKTQDFLGLQTSINIRYPICPGGDHLPGPVRACTALPEVFRVTSCPGNLLAVFTLFPSMSTVTRFAALATGTALSFHLNSAQSHTCPSVGTLDYILRANPNSGLQGSWITLPTATGA